ncbi:Hint domain-containing protein [Shimia biformata]|uniref:Hint domain-containing protein n=1 Tax=Shimia biformata TaxID=1294299 RepID=UPI0019517B10|nr:Hint domain-containing protein [Shimia biformata]
MTISRGGQLSGITQGNGSHLVGRSITLNANAWEAIEINDTEASFDDSDNSQSLNGSQSFDGTTYSGGVRVEAEYSLTLEDPDGNQYTVVGFNINEGGGASYATVEGLAFVGGFPPIGVELTVVSSQEGPSVPYVDLAAPPCFTAGAMIETVDGPRPIETLQAGDLVKTRDRGLQPLKRLLRTHLPDVVLKRHMAFRPVQFQRDALGRGVPARDVLLSPQHRVLVSGWRAELFFGEDEVLVPATRLVNDSTIRTTLPTDGITYFHLVFEQHEIVMADGMESESYLPGGVDAVDREMAALSAHSSAEGGVTSRPVATGPGCALLRAVSART